MVAENFKAGTMDRMGLGYDDIAAVHPPAIYVSVSGFGNTVRRPRTATGPPTPPIVEAMSGIYDFKAGPTGPPSPSPSARWATSAPRCSP